MAGKTANGRNVMMASQRTTRGSAHVPSVPPPIIFTGKSSFFPDPAPEDIRPSQPLMQVNSSLRDGANHKCANVKDDTHAVSRIGQRVPPEAKVAGRATREDSYGAVLRFPLSRTVLWDVTPVGHTQFIRTEAFLPTLKMSPDMARTIVQHALSGRCAFAVTEVKTVRDGHAVLEVSQVCDSAPSDGSGIAILYGKQGSADKDATQRMQTMMSFISSSVPLAARPLPLMLIRVSPEHTNGNVNTSSIRGPSANIELLVSSPPGGFRCTPLRQLRIVPSTLSAALSSGGFSLNSTLQTGFMTLDQGRRLLLLEEGSPMACDRPVVGAWVSGVRSLADPFALSACHRYTRCDSIAERASNGCRSGSQSPFLLVVYPEHVAGTPPTPPLLYECTLVDPENTGSPLVYQSLPVLVGPSLTDAVTFQCPPVAQAHTAAAVPISAGDRTLHTPASHQQLQQRPQQPALPLGTYAPGYPPGALSTDWDSDATWIHGPAIPPMPQPKPEPPTTTGASSAFPPTSTSMTNDDFSKFLVPTNGDGVHSGVGSGAFMLSAKTTTTTNAAIMRSAPGPITHAPMHGPPHAVSRVLSLGLGAALPSSRESSMASTGPSTVSGTGAAVGVVSGDGVDAVSTSSLEQTLAAVASTSATNADPGMHALLLAQQRELISLQKQVASLLSHANSPANSPASASTSHGSPPRVATTTTAATAAAATTMPSSCTNNTHSAAAAAARSVAATTAMLASSVPMVCAGTNTTFSLSQRQEFQTARTATASLVTPSMGAVPMMQPLSTAASRDADRGVGPNRAEPIAPSPTTRAAARARAVAETDDAAQWEADYAPRNQKPIQAGSAVVDVVGSADTERDVEEEAIATGGTSQTSDPSYTDDFEQLSTGDDITTDDDAARRHGATRLNTHLTTKAGPARRVPVPSDDDDDDDSAIIDNALRMRVVGVEAAAIGGGNDQGDGADADDDNSDDPYNRDFTASAGAGASIPHAMGAEDVNATSTEMSFVPRIVYEPLSSSDTDDSFDGRARSRGQGFTPSRRTGFSPSRTTSKFSGEVNTFDSDDDDDDDDNERYSESVLMRTSFHDDPDDSMVSTELSLASRQYLASHGLLTNTTPVKVKSFSPTRRTPGKGQQTSNSPPCKENLQAMISSPTHAQRNDDRDRHSTHTSGSPSPPRRTVNLDGSPRTTGSPRTSIGILSSVRVREPFPQ